MSEARQARRSQRSVQTCTNCARRKIKCSKTIPCAACVRQNKTASCQREEVAVVTRQSTTRSRASILQEDPSIASQARAVTTHSAGERQATNSRSVHLANIHALSTGSSGHDSLPQIHDEILEQLLALTSSPESRLTNEAAAMLEFLTHGRRNILNQFIGRETAHTTPVTPHSSSVQCWDVFLSIENARTVLGLHQTHLTWMHNVVHMPTFLAEFEENLTRMDCDKSWLALYYALLSQTLYHIDDDHLPPLPLPIEVNRRTSRVLFDKSIETLYQAGFMDNHKLTSVQTICLLVQVAHNFDKSDLICVLVSTAIRIAQCLNLHRLGPDSGASTTNVQDTVSREVRKRVWWFLVRYDWLQIPFQNTCQIHPSQFNTPMPANCHDDVDRMIVGGRINTQTPRTYTITTWTASLHQLSLLMWHHQDRMSRVSDTYGETDTGSISARYEEVIRADSEIKALYVSWPEQFRDIDTIPSVHPSKDSLPAELMPAMLLMSTAQKVFTVHRQFQLSCFRDRRFAFSQLSCVAIAERSIYAFQKWPDCLEARICRRMWTTLSYVVSCCITLLFALLFREQNALTHDFEKIRHYVRFGKDFIGKEKEKSSIARRGVKLISRLMDLERSLGLSTDIEAEIGEAIRRVVLADEDGAEADQAEGFQIVFPYGQDLWESLMKEPLNSVFTDINVL